MNSILITCIFWIFKTTQLFTSIFNNNIGVKTYLQKVLKTTKNKNNNTLNLTTKRTITTTKSIEFLNVKSQQQEIKKIEYLKLKSQQQK